MDNQLTKQEFHQLSAVEQKQYLTYSPNCYIQNISDEITYRECLKIVVKAILFKGVNKTEEEEKAITLMFIESLKNNYSYLTIELINKTLLKNNYGEGFSVSPASLISCIEKDLYLTNLENKKKESQRKLEEERPKIFLPEIPQHKQDEKYLRQCYEDFLTRNSFFCWGDNLFNIIKKYNLYYFSEEEQEKATRRAKNITIKFLCKKKKEAKTTFSLKEAQAISKIIVNDVTQYFSYEDYYKRELCRIYFENLKEIDIMPSNLILNDI